MMHLSIQRLLPVLLTTLAVGFAGCAQSSASKAPVTKIQFLEANDMQELTHVGNVWISEQPTESDLIWMRDNYVSLVIDTRLRDEDRGFDERAYVVSLGMKYRSRPLDISQDFTIRYFDDLRMTLMSRRDVPTLIHGDSADRAAAVWLTYRVLDERVSYAQALNEAKLAGLSNDATIRLVNQYLLSNGVNINVDTDAVVIDAEPGPDEMIYHVTPADENTKSSESTSKSTTDSVRD
ncbi:MAG: hypothetical protein CBC35_11815 [Planctomycetes bacterium TMED75]|nr:hypothetical protein [Planctomycetaceae bacterium]OUU90417.1 MAG: hypothetical protein CBC35_11815 [Planctomycetes bacterium TMED75]